MHRISEVRPGNITELSKKAGLMVFGVYSSEPQIPDCKFVLNNASSVCAVLQRRYQADLPDHCQVKLIEKKYEEKKTWKKLLLAILNKWKLMQRNLLKGEQSNLKWATFWFTDGTKAPGEWKKKHRPHEKESVYDGQQPTQTGNHLVLKMNVRGRYITAKPEWERLWKIKGRFVFKQNIS